MHIAFFEIEAWEKAYIEKQLDRQVLSFYEGILDEENVATVEDAEIISIFIYSRITKELLEKLPNLKVIITRSTGFDHIDLAACKKKQITVCNIPTYGTHTVAEHTFALILAISRKIVLSVERTRKGDFSLEGLCGFDLAGKTLGIAGFGNIGSVVADIAHSFGMHILAYTKHEIKTDTPVQFVDFDHLLHNSDIISFHLPYTKETHHILNKENIMKLKKGSVVINTARGGLIETEALLAGLDSGQIAACGIDVLEEECMIKEERQLLTGLFLKECDVKTQLLNHVLLTRENVIITPHNAFNSIEALRRILDVTAENIKSILAHKPINTVAL